MDDDGIGGGGHGAGEAMSEEEGEKDEGIRS